jgi:hypothetical protein
MLCKWSDGGDFHPAKKFVDRIVDWSCELCGFAASKNLPHVMAQKNTSSSKHPTHIQMTKCAVSFWKLISFLSMAEEYT